MYFRKNLNFLNKKYDEQILILKIQRNVNKKTLNLNGKYRTKWHNTRE